MIQMGSVLTVADNSGAKIVRCVKVLGGSKKMCARIADKVVVSVREVLVSNKVKIGEVFHAVVVRTKNNIKRNDGVVIKFSDNAVVLFDKQNELIGTRIFGPVPREIKDAGFQKIVSLSYEVV